MSRPPGFFISEQQKRAMQEGRAQARARRYKSKTITFEPELVGIDRSSNDWWRTCAKSSPQPDMKRIEKAPASRKARLRTLEANTKTLLELASNLHRQATQLALEEP